MVTRRKFIFENDYDVLQKWWKDHGNEHAPDASYLSDTGIVVEIEGKPVAMIFMYHTNSSICIAEFFTVDPKAEKKDREEALDFLIKSTKEWAKNLSYKLVYVSTNIKKYIKRLKDKGFKEVDTNMSHCFYEVNHE